MSHYADTLYLDNRRLELRRRRSQDWRKCGTCAHDQTAHRWGMYVGSCACCSCPGWRPTNPYRACLRLGRWLFKVQP